VDGAGKYLLALIARSGTQLTASGPEMKDLLQAIAKEWPLRGYEDIS
jgi:hypothetical protein